LPETPVLVVRSNVTAAVVASLVKLSLYWRLVRLALVRGGALPALEAPPPPHPPSASKSPKADPLPKPRNQIPRDIDYPPPCPFHAGELWAAQVRLQDAAITVVLFGDDSNSWRNLYRSHRKPFRTELRGE